MKQFNHNWFWALLLGLMIGTAGQAQIRVEAQVGNTEPIYMGNRFFYSIIIEGDNQPGQVDISPLAAYDPQSAGMRDLTQRSVRIYNGRRTVNEVKRLAIDYSMLAKSPGSFTLPPVSVTVDKETYRTNPTEIKVLKPGTTDKLDLEVTLSDTVCYVGQPVLMTVHFYVLAASAQDTRLSSVDIPGFDPERFVLEDLEIPEEDRKLLNLASGLPAYMTQTEVTHEKRRCVDVAISKVLIPKVPGTHTLGQTSVSASLAVGRIRSNDPFENMGLFAARKRYAQFMVTAPSQDLEVRPLPTERQPENFSGLVGRYSIQASATPTQVDVGQALTFTLKVGGNPFLKPVLWPDLGANAELISNFSIPAERSAPVVEDGFKVFTQTLRANNNDVTRIPPIELCYFDPDKGDYAVVKTKPIALDVAQTKTLTAQDMEGQLSSPVNRQIRAIQEGLSANTQDLDALVNRRFSVLGSALAPTLAPVWAVPLIALLISVVTKVVTHSNPVKIAHKRRQQAASKAVKRLTAWHTAPSEEQNEFISQTLRRFVGERFDRAGAALTAEDCFLILRDHIEDIAVADRFKSILTRCEASQYAPQELDIDQRMVDDATELIRTIHGQIRL